MAVKFWVGTTDGDWGTAGNWSPSGVPIAADDVIFDGKAVASLDGYDASGTALSSLSVVKGFKKLYTIGTSASADGLLVSATNVTIDVPGSSATGIFIEGKNITNCWVKDCERLALSGNFDFLEIQKGLNITLEGTGADVPFAMSAGDTLRITYINNKSSDAQVTIEAGTTLPTTAEVEIFGGKITNNTDITTLNCRDMQWTNTAGDITTLRLQSGQFLWNGGDITGGEVGPAKLLATNSDAERTVTTLKMLHPTCVVDIDDRAGNVTVTNPVIYDGGTITIAANQTIDLTA